MQRQMLMNRAGVALMEHLYHKWNLYNKHSVQDTERPLNKQKPHHMLYECAIARRDMGSAPQMLQWRSTKRIAGPSTGTGLARQVPKRGKTHALAASVDPRLPGTRRIGQKSKIKGNSRGFVHASCWANADTKLTHTRRNAPQCCWWQSLTIGGGTPKMGCSAHVKT